MSQKDKIEKILDSVKLEVKDIESFEKVIDSILDTFNQIKDVNVDGIDASLNRKKVSLDNLRDDVALDSKFRTELRGKYFKVPNVSKKK